jgi:5-methylcytosine-specific restriction endonuclease McrA
MACRRIKAARLSQEHPQVLEYLASGELTLSSLNALGSSPSTSLLEQSRGKSKREVERLVSAKSPDSHPPRRRYLDADEEYEELLRQARDLDPGDELEVLKKSLMFFVAQKKKQRFAQVERPRQSSGKNKDVSAPARREVFERDGGRCSFVGKSGKRCESTHLLEYDHIKARALGGEHDADNLRLLCRAHNQYVAEQVFGEEKLRRERKSTALRRDALSALTNLGFSKNEARTTLEQVMGPDLEIEPLLRAALRELRPHP